MPRKANQSDVWDFTVQKQRLNLPSGKPSNTFAIVRTDTDTDIGTVSEDGYGILQNLDLVSTIRESLQKLGLSNYNEKIVATNEGSRLHAVYTFPDINVTLPRKREAKVGDVVSMRLAFANSFDRSILARGELQALKLACTNGMMMPDSMFSLFSRHNPNINTGFVSQVISAAAEKFEDSLGIFAQMLDIALTEQQGINILKRLPIAKRTAGKVEGVWIEPDFTEHDPRTLYALYDAMTQHFTHNVENNSETPRFELAQKQNRAVLAKLTRMVREADFFAEMVSDLPVVDVEIVETVED